MRKRPPDMGRASGGALAVTMSDTLRRVSGPFQCTPATHAPLSRIARRRRAERGRAAVIVELAYRRGDHASMMDFLRPILDFVMTSPPPPVTADLIRQLQIAMCGLQNMLLEVALDSNDKVARHRLGREAQVAERLIGDLERAIRAEEGK